MAVAEAAAEAKVLALHPVVAKVASLVTARRRQEPNLGLTESSSLKVMRKKGRRRRRRRRRRSRSPPP